MARVKRLEIIAKAKQWARDNGSTTYFTGLRCDNGHIEPRFLCNGVCKGCQREWGRTHRTNPEKQAEYDKRHHFKNHEINKKKTAASVKRWREAHPEESKLAVKKYREKNKEKVKESKRKAEQKKPEKYRLIRQAAKAKRRAKEKVGGKFKPADIRRIFFLQKGMCAYCRTGLIDKYHIDHIVPISKGGTNWPKNLQLCCQFCNSSKGARDPLDFARSTGRLI